MSEPENVVAINLDQELTKQNSIFSLTLDEIQSKSGKNFGSMNMDEFLANVWSVEDNNQSPSSHLDEPSVEKCIPNNQPLPLTRQGSFSVPIALCNKTVEEVWSEIHKDKPEIHSTSNVNISCRESFQREHTLGDMTLEDFLVKAGVVQESSQVTPDKNVMIQHNVGTNVPNVPENGFATYGNGNEKCSSLMESSSGAKTRKRIIDGPPEAVVERRHRRMIKNRESAARSRARKQAYTIELEVELNQLREENENLKEAVAEIERKRKQEIKNKRRAKGEEMDENSGTVRRTVSMAW